MPMDIHGIAPLLQVFDMPTALEFYRGVLGFEVITAAPPGDKVSGDELKREPLGKADELGGGAGNRCTGCARSGTATVSEGGYRRMFPASDKPRTRQDVFPVHD